MPGPRASRAARAVDKNVSPLGVPLPRLLIEKRAYSLLAKRSTANDWLDYTYTAIPIDRQMGLT